MPSITEIAKSSELISLVESLDRDQAAARIGGLMLLPRYQANVLRFEMLAHLVAGFSQGTEKLSRETLDRILNGWLRDLVGPDEKPPRDVFVANLVASEGNRRLLVGEWETMDYWLQDILSIVESMPEEPSLLRIKSSCSCLLSGSEAILHRANLSRNAAGTGNPGGEMSIPSEDEIASVANTIALSPTDLESLGISSESLKPFILQEEDRARLRGERLGNSSFERHPLVQTNDHAYLLALPTAACVSLIYFLLENLQRLNLLAEFDRRLRLRQEGTFFDDALRTATRTRQAGLSLPSPLTGGLDWITQHAVLFDENKAALFVLLHDNPETILNVSVTEPNCTAVDSEHLFGAHVARLTQVLVRQGYQHGLVLFILCGLGRGFILPRSLVPPNWSALGIRLSDLIGVSWTEDSWLTSFWKLHLQMKEILDKGGVSISGVSEYVDLFAYLKNQGRLVPVEAPYRQKNLEIALEDVYLEKFRRSARLAFDRHAIFHPPTSRWRAVQKLYPETYFAELSLLPLYASIDDAKAQLLNGVVESSRNAFWIHVWPTPEPRWQLDLVYLVWEGCVIWLGKTASVLETRFPHLKSSTVVRIDVAALRNWKEPNWNELPKDGEATTVLVDHNYRIIIALNLVFFRLLARVDNRAERTLLHALILGFSQLHGEHLTQTEIDKLVAQIMPSNDAKFIHVFQAQDIHDQLADLDRPELRVPDKPDILAANLGIAWDVIAPGSTNKISGKKKSQKFLHDVVDVAWRRIRAQLQILNKEAAINTFVRNVEAASLERTWWRRTSRALLAVYRDREDVMRAAREAESRFSKAGLCSRVAVEMANCECRMVGGVPPATSSIDALLADISLLIVTAFDSDAIHSDVVDPQVEIAPNGEFRLHGDFFEDIVQPYQTGYFADQFEKAAEQYRRLFDRRSSSGRPVEQLFHADYLSAFEAEYGFALPVLVHIEQLLSQESIKQSRIVTNTTLDRLIVLLLQAGLKKDQVPGFLESFILTARPRWDQTPNGFCNHDWEPWRFRRRLSLLTRPLVRLDDATCAPVIYGAGVLHQSFGSVVDGAYTGRFDTEFFRSNAMKTWVGRVNNEAGHDFNRKVAGIFREEGFQARDSVMISELDGPAELGDCDVLAWCSTQRVIYAVECKKLRSALTIGEICDQLVRFKGEEQDDLHRHLQRLKWLETNRQSLVRFLKLPSDEFEIRPLLVTNTTVPAAFQKNLPIRQDQIVTIRELKNVVKKSSA